ncbi:hypothetical protein GpartN1_g905.t1 [Galdieria partita]|uniref:Uncharacterized protein n=1 Tax=Galdieria partita TaxID=83374 RepID=A0A9C7UMX4_9RHOD|nr:hypothetical protein GpartN1_g905.t1 [Galdieria partita]
MSVTAQKSSSLSTQDALVLCTIAFMGYVWKKLCDMERGHFSSLDYRKLLRKRRNRMPPLLNVDIYCWKKSSWSIYRKKEPTPLETAKSSSKDKKESKNRQVRFSEANEVMNFDGERRVTKRKGEIIRGILRNVATDRDAKVKDSIVSPLSSPKESEYDSMERYVTLLAKKIDRSIRLEMDAIRIEIQQIRKLLNSHSEKDLNWRNSGEPLKKWKMSDWERSNNNTSPSLSSKKDLFLQSQRPVTRIEKSNQAFEKEQGPSMKTVTYLSNHLGAVRKVILEPNELSWSKMERSSFRVITASEDCTLKLWNLEANYATHSTNLLSSADSYNNSSDHKTLNTPSVDQSFMTSLTCESIHTYRGHLAPILSAQIFPDMTLNGTNGLLVSGDAQGSLLFWDIPKAEEAAAYMSYHQLFPFQRYIVTNVHEGECIWDICKPLRDSPLMATAGADGTVKLWDYSSFRWDDESPIHRYTQMEPLGIIRFCHGDVNSERNHPIVFGVDTLSFTCGNLLVGSELGILCCIDLKERSISNRWYTNQLVYPSQERLGSIYAIETVNSVQVLLGGSAGNMILQDLRMEKPSQEIERAAGASAMITCVCSIVDNYWFACGGSQSMIRFWDIRKMDNCLQDLNIRKSIHPDKCCIWSLLNIPNWNCLLAATSLGYTFICSKDI